MWKYVNHSVVRDTDWTIRQNDDGTFGSEQVNRAILLDIRAELKLLNAHFRCYNFVRIPMILDAIARDTRLASRPERRREENARKAKAAARHLQKTVVRQSMGGE